LHLVAEAEHRSLASMVEIVVQEYARARNLKLDQQTNASRK